MQKDDNADIVAREGDNITLDCDARGHPSPQVVWRREDKEDILVNGRKGNSIKQMIKIHCLEILSKIIIIEINILTSCNFIYSSICCGKQSAKTNQDKSVTDGRLSLRCNKWCQSINKQDVQNKSSM